MGDLNGFTVAGLLALGYCLAVFLDAKFFEARESRNFARQLRWDTVAATAHSGSPVPAVTPVVKPRDGGTVGRLEIPRVGVSVMVVEGVKDGDLKRAAGHIPGTPLPGEPGKRWHRGAQRYVFPALAFHPSKRRDHRQYSSRGISLPGRVYEDS
jgi:sortase (surface protein transpeptidase)